jgi:hypothetical protein
MRLTIKAEYSEPLKYLAKLQGRSADSLVGEILEDWLTNNYCETAEQGEDKHGLFSTVITKRGGSLNESAAFIGMRQNMRILASPKMRALYKMISA